LFFIGISYLVIIGLFLIPHIMEKDKPKADIPEKIPPVLVAKRTRKRIVVQLNGTLQQFSEGGAKWTVDSKTFFAPQIKADSIERMIPIKVNVCSAKHNLPIALSVELPVANKTVYDKNNIPHAVVMAPNSQLKKKKIFFYEDRIDPSALLAASKMTPQILSCQAFPITDNPQMKLATPWLYNQIQLNAKTIEQALNKRVSAMAGFQLANGPPLYPVEATAAEYMLKLCSNYISQLPFQKLSKEFTIEFSPLETTWKALVDKYSQGNSVADQAMLNMPYSIFLEIKYVYAILDD
jgi:hypothetical protein